VPSLGPLGPICEEKVRKSTDDGNSEIYVMNADGSFPTNLTRNIAIDVQPSWSPDGQRIAFLR